MLKTVLNFFRELINCICIGLEFYLSDEVCLQFYCDENYYLVELHENDKWSEVRFLCEAEGFQDCHVVDD
jgi:hypothetical protein